MRNDHSNHDRAAGKVRIAVIGGGASGCMAAISAARAGARVDLFEKNEKPGKKIYATGNGKCNLTNLMLDASCYRAGNDPEGTSKRILKILTGFSREDLLAFFADAGVPVHDRGGYVYPRTDQAETVALALEKQIRNCGVRVRTGCTVRSIEKTTEDNGKPAAGNREEIADPTKDTVRIDKKGRFTVTYFAQETDVVHGERYAGSRRESRHRKSSFQGTGRTGDVSGRERQHVYDAVILCTGGLAGPAFGCSGDGYDFAVSMGHSLIAPLPSLTKLLCREPLLKRASGVRCHAAVTILETGERQPGTGRKQPVAENRISEAGKRKPEAGDRQPETAGGRAFRESILAREEGELQITDDGLSGIPVFQLSGTAARCLEAGRRITARIDFLPEFPEEAYEAEMQRRLREDRDQMLGSLFLGLVHRKVIDLLLAREGLQAEMKARRLTEEQLRKLFLQLRTFELEVAGTGTFQQAQVTTGGIPLSEVEDQLASKIVPGLYMAGELLDVDGRCGGYNLQWAMSSGWIAGRAAAERTARSSAQLYSYINCGTTPWN